MSLWRTDDGERLFNWSHKTKEDTMLIAADFSPDGVWAATADVHTLALWNVQTGEAPRFWSAPGDILAVQLSQDGKTALLGLSDHTAVLFDIRRGGIIQTFNHLNRVRSVALSADGRHALTGSEDYTAIFWDIKTGEALQKIRHNDDVQLVCLSPDSSLALSMGKYDKAVIWATATGEILGELQLKAEFIKRGLRLTSARFSADNQFLLTGRPDQIISLWQISTMQEVQRWKIPKRKAWKPQGAAIIDVAFSTQANQFLAISSNGFLSRLEL